jgi:hypothetical protein
MAVAQSHDGSLEVASDRPVLPLAYVTLLAGQLAVLGTLVAMFGNHPPYAYEAGWVGTGSMVAMQIYSVRRRVRFLRHLGSLRAWLDLHIFLGFQGYILVAYHSVGIAVNANLAAANFALVTLIVATGVVGRYLYGFIPRARAGNAIAYAALVAELGPRALPSAVRRECRGLLDMIVLDLAHRKALRALARDPHVTPEQAHAARRSIVLSSRISALEVAEKWFARWTLFHRPLAIVVLGITVLHVLAHFAYAT